jgi:hypothetical protein
VTENEKISWLLLFCGVMAVLAVVVSLFYWGLLVGHAAVCR